MNFITNHIRTYYRLTKPGIIYGNALTAAAGFLFASQGQVDPVLFLMTIAGISLIIGSSCVINNYIDRGIDEKMSRTKNRALVTGSIPATHALIFAAIIGIAGLLLLIFFTNALTVYAGLVGVFFYLVMYTIWKRKSVHGTLIGSVSGATPIFAGYLAVKNQIDVAGLLLFLILILWQMPHFYAIAIFRSKEYESAHIPVLPLVKGVKAAKIQILLYAVAFVIATLLLAFLGYAGYTYLLGMLIAGFYWIYVGIRGIQTEEHNRWARKMFRFSLIILLLFSALISLDHFLP